MEEDAVLEELEDVLLVGEGVWEVTSGGGGAERLDLDTTAVS
jgi:hypothetical protein